MLSKSRLPLLLMLMLGLSAGIACAETATGFSAQIRPDDRASSGIGHLTIAQVGALDALIQRDIDAAVAGKTVAFAKTFTERRTLEERQQAGIEQLSGSERDRLDVLVASAIANRPGLTYVYAQPPASSPSDHILSDRTSAIVHGEVSLFVGGGSGGRSWYGASVETAITDPSRHFTVIVGASEVKGRGVRPCYYDGRLW